jgi:hypothetical protein
MVCLMLLGSQFACLICLQAAGMELRKECVQAEGLRQDMPDGIDAALQDWFVVMCSVCVCMTPPGLRVMGLL